MTDGILRRKRCQTSVVSNVADGFVFMTSALNARSVGRGGAISGRLGSGDIFLIMWLRFMRAFEEDYSTLSGHETL